MSRLAKFKANLKHYPDPEIGDTIKVGTGRAIWTIVGVFEDTRLVVCALLDSLQIR